MERGREEKELVSWSKLCKHKKSRGLRIRNTQEANLALMAKIGWHMIQEPIAIWCKMLKAKYEENHKLLGMFQGKQNASNIWKSLVKGAPLLQQGTALGVP